MNELSDEFCRHALGMGVGGGQGVGGGGVAVAVAGGAGCVSCCVCAFLRRGGRCPCCPGQGCLARVVQDWGHGPDSAARGVPQLQFWDDGPVRAVMRSSGQGC